MHKCRKAERWSFIKLISLAIEQGEADRALRYAEMAVEQGIWGHPLQRPPYYVPGLPALPFHDPAQFWIASHLERNYEAIKSAIDQIANYPDYGFRAVEEGLVQEGDWNHLRFYDLEHRYAETCNRLPGIAQVIDEVPRELIGAGVIHLSRLMPGTQLRPHCGHSNARLRVHLGITTSPDAGIRVGDKTSTWTEGRCIVLDDSFEHEAWNCGTEPRIILVFDTWHPSLTDDQKRSVIAERGQSLKADVGRFMRHSGLRQIELAGDEVDLKFDPERIAGIERRMRESRFRRICRSEDDEISFFAN